MGITQRYSLLLCCEMAAALGRVDLGADHEGHREEPAEQCLLGGPGEGDARPDTPKDKVWHV